ncbi:Ig-like domain-containing protein [Vitiosangium sp. GDMCC 1.1324]|uniref:Ig-like domain-containing protein n=1 Tax=Vitiosangium sp. (strain GDMCC 1.1324) TaxID=2138576 RepID=UPI00130DE8FA|nr:Ig-like domain-containing protein [Vitiosangium sp. GDMCC 1.1324]
MRVFLVAALALVACQDSSPSAVESSSSPGVARDWVRLGHPGELPQGLSAPPKVVKTGEGEESTALGFARAYYPEFFEGEGTAFVPPEAALKVEWPAAEGEAMTLSTRGHVFQVKADTRGARAPRRTFEGAVFYGSGHLWSMAGQGSQRVEEYVVLPEGTREHRVRYEVTVPEGVVAVRDAGSYLEFLDAREVPVLRMHYGVVRDVRGLARQGETRLRGVVATHREPARYALVERTLAVELVLGLEGMTGPLVVDPGWSSTGTMAVSRPEFTTALLPGGKVLAVGGRAGSGASAAAELYDPATGTWSSTGSMNVVRFAHTMTTLSNGKVLVTGGYTPSTGTPTAELYDPATGTWSLTSPMTASRTYHTATVLTDGRVLVAGGIVSVSLDIAELYDPATGTWTSTGYMPQRHSGHVAVLLANGKVLVAGGDVNGAVSALATVYDPSTSTWSATGRLATARRMSTATLLPDGKVLVAGGLGTDTYQALTSCELYDPATGTWSTTKNTIYKRALATATLLPNGKVLLVGGFDGYLYFMATNSGEVYDPTAALWTVTPLMSVARYSHSSLLLPDGRVLIMGGSKTATSAEIYEPSNATRLVSGALLTARSIPSATLLPSGKVLVVGGLTSSGAVAPTELFVPETSSASTVAGPAVPRTGATVTLLPNGRVLVAGGSASGVSSAVVEQYDPEANAWSATGSLGVPRSRQTATLLRDGRVLVTGGVDDAGVPLASAEVYDPGTGTWSPTGALSVAREGHIALSLPNGKVLVAAGNGTAGALASAEVYDPATGTWSPTGSLATARVGAGGVLLAAGQVLVVGGRTTSGSFLASAERYDPATGTWSAAGNLTTARDSATATLLPSGQALVAGGRSDTSGAGLTSLEVYEPRTNGWTVGTVSLAAGRHAHVAVPLPSGRVLLLGGGGTTPLAANEVYDAVGASDAWRPSVTLPTDLFQGSPFVASGSRFRGISEAGGGKASSPGTDFPAWVSLMPVGGGAVTRVTPTAFSSTSVSAITPGLAPGHYLLSVTVNGIPGGRVVRLQPGTVTAPDAVASTDEDMPVAVTLVASSRLGAPLTFSVVAPPAHGTLSGTAPNLTYTPAKDYFGGDSFRFRASDGTGSAEGTVTLTVRPTPDAPVVQPLSLSTVVGTPVAVKLSGLDADNDALSFTVVTGPSEGTLSGTAPDLLYTPPAGFAGTVTFTFQASDGSLVSNVATVTVTVALPSTAVGATYDSVLGAPQCVSAGSSCDSGSLLNGRGQLGPEPNQPNTIGPCLDGMAGAYHVDQSLDRLKVSAVNGGNFTAGKTVQIEATVWASDLYNDRLNLYYSANASSQNWVLIGTYLPPALGAQVIRVNYTLPAQAGVQAIRGIYYSGGSFNGACVYNSGIMDHDDLAFPVAAADAVVPTVALTSPSVGARVGRSVSLTASASDNVGVARVEFYDGTVLVSTRTAPPYTSTWNTANAANGTHTLSAKAYDAAGNVGTSASVSVTVDNQAPTVSLTAPGGGTTVGGPVLLSATASDESGVARVEFLVDGMPLGSAVSAPYVWTWEPVGVTPGTHVLSARAYDAAGNVGTSASVTVTVDNQAPTVSLTVPEGGTTVGEPVLLTATASDESGVTRVEFFVDDMLLGSAVSAPYAWTWEPVGPGTHVLSARAYDAAGNVGLSAPVSVLVEDPAPPMVSVDAPPSGAVRGVVLLSAAASDNVGVMEVVLYDGDTQVGVLTAPPYLFSWDTAGVADGPHALRVLAHDAGGNRGLAELSLWVDNQLPTVSVTRPGEGSTVTGTVTLIADALDNFKVARVDYYVDGMLVGSSDTEPYAFTWNSARVANGTHVLSARALDAADNVGDSAPVDFLVNNRGRLPGPRVSAPSPSSPHAEAARE